MKFFQKWSGIREGIIPIKFMNNNIFSIVPVLRKLRLAGSLRVPPFLWLLFSITLPLKINLAYLPDLNNFYRLEEVKAIEFSRTMVEFNFKII